MKIEHYLKRLETRGIRAKQIPKLSDGELLKVPGIGRLGLECLRDKFGPAREPKVLQLSDEVEHALYPVLLKRSGVGKGTIRTLARMVAAYFD